MTIYGQHEVLKDLVAAALERGIELRFEVSEVAVHELDTGSPRVTYVDAGGESRELVCDFIAGCDGFHGVCRPSIPRGVLTEHDFVYPFGWLGILAHAPPATDELIYSWHQRGFSLYSMRSPKSAACTSRCRPMSSSRHGPMSASGPSSKQRRRPGWRVSEGPVLEKGITAMRSFVCEPMQYGWLFLAGDAAHIVPPTGAKGLNLAINDVRLLAEALRSWYADGSRAALDALLETALRRVWRAQDFSNYMTQLMHDTYGGEFERRLQLSRLEYLKRSRAARTSLAENYAGLPAAPDF